MDTAEIVWPGMVETEKEDGVNMEEAAMDMAVPATKEEAETGTEEEVTRETVETDTADGVNTVTVATDTGPRVVSSPK